MDKNELKLAQIHLKHQKFVAIMSFSGLLVICGTIVLCICMILSGLLPLSLQSEGQINAIAKVVQSFHLGSIFGYALSAVTGAGWLYERKGKQRAISQKAHYQKIAESGDQNRGTSGLTEKGLTPKNK